MGVLFTATRWVQRRVDSQYTQLCGGNCSALGKHHNETCLRLPCRKACFLPIIDSRGSCRVNRCGAEIAETLHGLRLTHTPHDSLNYWISPNQEEWNLLSTSWTVTHCTPCKSRLTYIPYTIQLLCKAPLNTHKRTIWSLVFDNSNNSFSHFQALFGLWASD